MGVDHALDIGECLIENKVGRSVAWGVEVAFNNLAALEVDNNHILCLHLVVAHAAGLDDNETFLAIDTWDIAPGEDNEALLHQVQIGLEYFLFQFF